MGHSVSGNGFGNGSMAMPDFNGTMPSFSGSPSERNGQLDPQASGSQTNYTQYVVVGIVVVVVVFAVIGLVLIRKRKARQLVPPPPSQSAENEWGDSLMQTFYTGCAIGLLH